MEKNISNKNIYLLRSFLLSAIVLLIVSSCNPTKYVPRGELLLDETHVIINKEGIKKSELQPYIKQNPNKRIFGAKFHLGLYNLSNLNKVKWPHSWLRDIGEEPVIYDPFATEKSREQIQSYVASKGYFDSQVTEKTDTGNRKAKVFYNVNLRTPYTIRNLYYDFADTTIWRYYHFDSVNCMIERGKPYDVSVLQAERSRLERIMKDRGFYGFSGEYIFFEIDSTIGSRQVDITYIVKKFSKRDENNKVTLIPHPLCWVRNIYIYPNFVPRDVLEGGDAYLKSLDTILYKGFYFISAEKKPEIKYDLIIQSLYLKPGSVYNLTNTERSQSHLLSLKTFRLVNIIYNESALQDEKPGSPLVLDCTVQLTLLSQQSFKVEVEGTTSSGFLGGALNLIYQHKNLLHGAELFNMKLKGAYEALSQNDSLRSIQEYGFETSLRIPKFLFPFLQTEGFIKRYNPSTTLVAAYDYQDLPFYTRTLANANFGYTWNSNSFTTHIVNPVQLNRVKLRRIDPTFKARIDSSSYLAYSYRSIMILGASYSFIFNNQNVKKSKDYWFLRVNAEASGNLLGVASAIAGSVKKEGSYQFLGLPFAQYIRADIDLRYNININDLSSIVYRAFVGAGIPYGNSKAVPFEKQYFGGGANGIRAWQVRTLGPGTYVPHRTGFLNQTADIKIEANAEYRFKLFWILHGALFLDAGNIWSYNYDKSRPGSQFKFNKFYNDLAVGTGAGLRFDFSFVLMRADLGMKLRDPWISSGSRWIVMNRPYNFKDDFTLVVAIGYPF